MEQDYYIKNYKITNLIFTITKTPSRLFELITYNLLNIYRGNRK